MKNKKWYFLIVLAFFFVIAGKVQASATSDDQLQFLSTDTRDYVDSINANQQTEKIPTGDRYTLRVVTTDQTTPVIPAKNEVLVSYTFGSTKQLKIKVGENLKAALPKTKIKQLMQQYKISLSPTNLTDFNQKMCDLITTLNESVANSATRRAYHDNYLVHLNHTDPVTVEKDRQTLAATAEESEKNGSLGRNILLLFAGIFFGPYILIGGFVFVGLAYLIRWFYNRVKQSERGESDEKK